MRESISIFWFRRDLRLHDNAGLYHALKTGAPVQPIFIFDRNILDILEDRNDARVTFLHDTIVELQSEIQKLGSTLKVFYGKPFDVFKTLIETENIQSVFTNKDYEPYALQRDAEIEKLLSEKQIGFHKSKDHVIFEYNEITKDDGLPYTVFTPYSKKWRAKVEKRHSLFPANDNEQQNDESVSFFFKAYPTEEYFSNFVKTNVETLHTTSLQEMNFTRSDIKIPSSTVAQKIIRTYDATRNFPADEQGTSRLGIHFRFGTISIREKARAAQKLNETFLTELIWRDFYSSILQHFPRVANGEAFRPEYEKIEWLNDDRQLQAWQEGKTGYPIVDAGMRQLNETGYMHNRVRMIVSSFLTKHLLTNWRFGEVYFAKKLLDYDLASNSGGWQWAAGCGTDAAPYFRVFNPTLQQEKFDPKNVYVKRWVKEYGTANYPKPIVEHTFARNRCLEAYAKALKK